MDLGLEEDGGTFDDITFLYSAGFLLSGKNGDSLWVNGQAGSINMSTYLPGNVDSVYYDPRYKLYTLTSGSEPFSDSWLQWKYAVQLGADYYDGNHDGSYNPVDLNENGKWDTGDYIYKIQPEKVQFFSSGITIRANWDVEEDWEL